MSCEILIKVNPKSSRNEVADLSEGVWIIRIKAIPEKGKANAELIRFLSKTLNISQSSIEIVRGSTGRIKRLRILGIDLLTVETRLRDALESNSG